MHVALTLPNAVSNQNHSRWGIVQPFDALSPEALNTSFFLSSTQESPVIATSSFENLNTLTVGGQAKAILETERAIIQLNQEFAELAFSASDFNRISSASAPVLIDDLQVAA